MFDLTKCTFFLHRAPVCARKDHLVYRDEMSIMDLPGEKGVEAPPGPRGIKGQAKKVAAEERNWKQRVWKKADVG